MKTIVRPLGDRIMAKVFKEENIQKIGGIIVPNEKKGHPGNKARVVAVGPGKNNYMPVYVGDLVLLDRYPYPEFEINGEAYVVCTLSDVIGILKESE